MLNAMQFGVCGGPDIASLAAAAGYHFVETTVQGLLLPTEEETAFQGALANMQDAGVPCPVVNCFIPGSLKIVGPESKPSELRSYVRTLMSRAKTAGIDTIVFGSGGARRVPEGFERALAHRQLLEFASMAADMAEAAGVTIVLEPLNQTECNIFNSVSECAAFVREINHPGFRLLADAYHMMKDGDPFATIKEAKDLLSHIHVATVPNRFVPGAEPCELEAFFSVLKDSGYHGRVSIEAKIAHPEVEVPAALAFLRKIT